MTPAETSYVNAIGALVLSKTGSPSVRAAFKHDLQRTVHIAGNPAYYGKAHTLIVELEGSPPKSVVLLSGIQHGAQELTVNGRRLRTSKHIAPITAAVLALAKERGIPV